jgi:sigma-B regulation protein RsbU (phosphoserine phosphatase)
MTASVFDLELPARPRTSDRRATRTQFDVHAISVPSRMFTGDFWFTHHTADRLWFALGDVAGKGLPAALVMAMIQEELERRIASCARAGCDPATTMQRLHQFLKPLLPSNRFATAVIGWLRNDGSMTIVNAGHCPPMLVRADGSIEEIDSTGPVVGIMASSRWTSSTFTLNAGDLLILYSDGVVESQSIGGEEFGVDRIRHILARAFHTVCSAVQDVASASISHAQGRRYDDLTLMAIGFEASRNSSACHC